MHNSSGGMSRNRQGSKQASFRVTLSSILHQDEEREEELLTLEQTDRRVLLSGLFVGTSILIMGCTGTKTCLRDALLLL